MTEDELVKSLEDVSVAEAFKNAKGTKFNEFRIFWIHKSKNAEEGSHLLQSQVPALFQGQ